MPDTTIDATALALARRVMFEANGRAGTSGWIEATGTSMRPLVAPGDWLHVDFGQGTPQVGDMALFELSGRIVAHRVVGSRRRDGRRLLVCKGDAVPFFDPAVAPDQVLGVVRERRCGPDGTAVTAGCTGVRARAVAGVSRWCGRWAWWARRGAAVLPGPATRRAATLVADCGRAVTWSVARVALVGW
jgi:hypothetical protein